MATNPSDYGTDIKLAGDNPVNDPTPRKRTTSNKFNTSYPHVTTARYGTVTPFYVANTVEKELHPLYSAHEVRTLTMESPRFGGIKMKKTYFDVPIRAIYPLNYDLMKVPPVEGDDINDLQISNKAYIPGGFFSMALINVFRDYDSSQFDDSQANHFVKGILFLEKFFSRASLFDYLGCHLSSVFRVRYPRLNIGNYDSFDLWFERICDLYFNNPEGFTIKIVRLSDRKVFIPYTDSVTNPSSATQVSIHYILELLRDDFQSYSISLVPQTTDYETIADDPYFKDIFSGIQIRWNSSNDLNIERIIAYQLACAEFYTDDHIDNIYSTDQFRNMMRYYFNSVFIDSGFDVPYFEINGVRYQYDVFSNAFWAQFVLFILSGYLLDFLDSGACQYVLTLLTKRHSLRFEDYFVGGRLKPVAVGDTDVPVVDGKVDAYEVARAQVFTRFLNSVNLSGPEFDTYSKDILDNNAPPRVDVPKLIGSTMSNVTSYEVENTTSEGQGNLVTNVRSSDERFAFQVTLDHDSIVIGVVTFEARRMYSKSVDRFFYHTDRYDSFNPRLQHMGDQNISLAELRAGADFDDNFAYGVSDGEYKQRFGVVSGGVVDFLPSWSMVTDTKDSYDEEDNLNSSYIRNKDVEFDRFFSSLSNNSDAGYFHFILYFDNQTEPIKPMVVAPEILL